MKKKPAAVPPLLDAAITSLGKKMAGVVPHADIITEEIKAIEDRLNEERLRFEISIKNEGDTFWWMQLPELNDRFGFVVDRDDHPQLIANTPIRFRLRLRELIPEFLILIGSRITELTLDLPETPEKKKK